MNVETMTISPSFIPCMDLKLESFNLVRMNSKKLQRVWVDYMYLMLVKVDLTLSGLTTP